MPDMYQTIPPKKRLTLMPLFHLLGIIAITVGLGFAATFLSGFLSAFSANIVSQDGITYFDPLITISYLIVFYFLTYLYPFTSKQRGYYFLLSLALSFTINFVEGTLLLVALYPVLKKLKLIETTP